MAFTLLVNPITNVYSWEIRVPFLFLELANKGHLVAKKLFVKNRKSIEMV